MRDDDWLAAEFETSRPRLHAVAYRMLGSHADADDAVQEAWLRLAGGDHDRIENVGGLLTTVVGRVCLDRLRARRRLQGSDPDTDTGVDVERARQREVVDAFLRAAHGGDFDALVRLLDPEVVLVPDAAAMRMGSLRETVGATAVATALSGGAKGARLAIIDGLAGFVWAPTGPMRGVVEFTVANGKIVALRVTGDRLRLESLDIVPVD